MCAAQTLVSTSHDHLKQKNYITNFRNDEEIVPVQIKKKITVNVWCVSTSVPRIEILTYEEYVNAQYFDWSFSSTPYSNII